MPVSIVAMVMMLIFNAEAHQPKAPAHASHADHVAFAVAHLEYSLKPSLRPADASSVSDWMNQ